MSPPFLRTVVTVSHPVGDADSERYSFFHTPKNLIFAAKITRHHLSLRTFYNLNLSPYSFALISRLIKAKD